MKRKRRGKNELIDSPSVLESSSKSRVSGVRGSSCRFFGDRREEDVEGSGSFVGEERSEDDLEVPSVTRTLQNEKAQFSWVRDATTRGKTHKMMDEEEHIVGESFRKEVGWTEVPSTVILR